MRLPAWKWVMARELRKDLKAYGVRVRKRKGRYFVERRNSFGRVERGEIGTLGDLTDYFQAIELGTHLARQAPDAETARRMVEDTLAELYREDLDIDRD